MVGKEASHALISMHRTSDVEMDVLQAEIKLCLPGDL
jgi:hypothetical protein